MDQTAVEGLARRWCVLSGNDPDKAVAVQPAPNANGSVKAVHMTAPYWQVVAHEIVPMFAWVQLYIEFHKGAKDAQPKIITPNG